MPRHLTTNDSPSFVATTEVGTANGVASLDGTGKVPNTQLPTFATSPVASVNGHTGAVVLGATDVGAVSIAAVNTNNGVAPLDSTGRLPAGNLPTTAVTSVNGHVGPTATLAASDVGAVSIAAVNTNNGVAPLDSTGHLPVSNLPVTTVTSVNGHAGPTVTLAASDVGAVPIDTLWINVKNHGAVGDGTTDDTAAFQTVANLINTAGGGTMFIPPANYKLNGTVHLGANTTVSAYGAYIFAGVGAGQPFLDNYLNQTSPTVYNGNGNITILGGIWDAKGQTYTTDNADTMFFGHASYITMRDVTIRNTRGYHGVEYNAINVGTIAYCRFEGYSTAGNTSHGEAIQIDVAISGAGQPANDGTESTRIIIEGCYAGPATDGSGLGSYGSLAGAHSAQGGNSFQDIRIAGCTADSCLYYGIHAYNWAKCQITGNTITNTGDAGIQIDTQTTGGYQPDAITVTGNSITGATNYGININGGGAFASNYVADISVTGNTVRNITAGTGLVGIEIMYATGATVTGNTIYNATTTGIAAQNCTYVTIGANTVHSCNNGLSIAGSTQVQVTGNNLNTGTSNGIFLGQTGGGANTSDVIVSGNLVENYTNAQVRGGTSATDVLVVNNKLVKGANGTFGVELVSTNTTWTVIDNWLEGSWTLGNALNGFTTTTNVTVTPDGKFGIRGSNYWGAQLNPKITTATVANTASETVVGTFTIPANDAQTGGVYRATVYGTASSTGTPTITFKIRLGGVSGQVLASFPAITTASGVASGGWLTETRLLCIANGVSSTWSASSTLNQQIASTTNGASAVALTNGTVSVDSTANQTLVVTATWSAASSSNTVSSTAGLLYRDY